MESKRSNTNTKKGRIPGYIQASLVNILEYDPTFLSQSGYVWAKVFKRRQDGYATKLKQQACELDEIFKQKPKPESERT